MGAGPHHALPKSAQIQGLLCEKDQLAGYAGSTAMQIGLDRGFKESVELTSKVNSMDFVLLLRYR